MSGYLSPDNLRQNLEVRQDLDSSERELIMRLAPLYQEDRERARYSRVFRRENRGKVVLL